MKLKSLIIAIQSIASLLCLIIGIPAFIAGAKGIYVALPAWDGFSTLCLFVALLGTLGICFAVWLFYTAKNSWEALQAEEKAEEDEK